MTRYEASWPSAFNEDDFADRIADVLAKRREFVMATADGADFMADMAKELAQIPEVRRAIGAAVFAGAFAGTTFVTVQSWLLGLGWQWSTPRCWTASAIVTGVATAAWLVGDVARHPLQNIAAEIADQLSHIDFRLPAIVFAKDADDHAAGVVYTGDSWKPVAPPDGASAGECVAFAHFCKANSQAIAEGPGCKKYGISGPKFRKLRDWAIDWDWLRWRNEDNHRLGCRITSNGHRYFDRLLGHSPTAPAGR